MKSLDSQMNEQPMFDYAVKEVADKPEVHEKFKETTVKGSASSSSPCSNSQALAQAVVKLLTLSSSHSSSATECTLPTLQAVHQSGVALLPQLLIQ